MGDVLFDLISKYPLDLEYAQLREYGAKFLIYSGSWKVSDLSYCVLNVSKEFQLSVYIRSNQNTVRQVTNLSGAAINQKLCPIFP